MDLLNDCGTKRAPEYDARFFGISVDFAIQGRRRQTMRMFCRTLTFLALSLAACSGKEDSLNSDKVDGAGAAGSASDHGEKTDLGTLTLAGNSFGLTLLGKVMVGKESAVEVRPLEVAPEKAARWNLYLWVEDKAGVQLSAPAKGSLENGAIHFHVTPREKGTTPVRVVLRLRADGVDERAGLPLDGHGHEHKFEEGPHSGVSVTFASGDASGHLELKLHDDKGDVELWLSEDDAHSEPFDLSLASVIEIEFVDVGGRKISLHPRNQQKNEDEDGHPNVRGERTNYFIYPSAAGEDAEWLKGKEFQSIVIVRFTRGGMTFVSEEFVLTPHVH